MRVRGEAFFLLNGWMNFLCLYLAAAIRRTRFSLGRTVLAALLGALYAVWAVTGPKWAGGIAGLAGCGLVLSAVAFGRRCPRLMPFVLLSGWALSGLTEFLRSRGMAVPGIFAICGVCTIGAALLLRRSGVPSCGTCTLRIVWQGREVRLPAIRDSGNLLTDNWIGLPVIVAPARALTPLLPEGVRPEDLSTLPPGFRLIRASTAAGSRTLMCFVPDRRTVIRGGMRRKAEAAVALSGFRERRALLPDAIFSGKGEKDHAGG